MATNLLLPFEYLSKPIKEISMSESKRDDWRELCAAAAKEPDSDKLVSLVNQILDVLDERQKQSPFSNLLTDDSQPK
jgi:hypothetical protein